MKRILLGIIAILNLSIIVLIASTKNYWLMGSFILSLFISILYIVRLDEDAFKTSLFDVFTKRYTDVVFFEINFKDNIIYFINNELLESSQMSLQEFAIRVLKINATSSEIIAMYIGKLDFDTYKENNKYTIKCLESNRNSMYGYIRKN